MVYLTTSCGAVSVWRHMKFLQHIMLSQNRFYCDLCCFVSKLVLSGFTHFCVEKNLTTNFVCGEKIYLRLRLQLRKMFHRQDYAFCIANMFQPEMLNATLEFEDPHNCEGFSIVHICHTLKKHTLKFFCHAQLRKPDFKTNLSPHYSNV